MAGRHRVVIIGGGFGGLHAARALRRIPVDVTLIDRRNFHLFQPLLYQVATGGLSPANIAAPLRNILKQQRNAQVLLAEAVAIDAAGRRVLLDRGSVEYDTLIVATGVSHNYFGHDEWAELAPGLKTVEDATEMRARILSAFEAAEREPSAERVRELLTFVVVGGGPTGVELAGALAEIARDTLRHEFRRINPAQARIVLLDAAERVLGAYPPDLSAKAERSLAKLGVTVMTGVKVAGIEREGTEGRGRGNREPGTGNREQQERDRGREGSEGAMVVAIERGGRPESLLAHTVLWAAGVQGSPLGRALAEACGAELDRAGRVRVRPDLSVAGHPEIFVIGDLAYLEQDGRPLPGTAPVAMQAGDHVAGVIAARLGDRTRGPFRYVHRGSMATIGRAAAVADFGRMRISGYLAWLAWLFIHLFFLIEFQNRVLVLIQWAWNYATFNRAARLITGEAAEREGRD